MGEITEEIKRQQRSLERTIGNLQNDIRAFLAEKNELIQKKQRLITARNRVATQKYQFRSIKSGDEANIDNKKSWKGSTYESFKQDGNTLKDADRNYEKAIDRVHDDMNNEIARLEKEIAHRTGLLSSINAEINSLNTRLANLFN